MSQFNTWIPWSPASAAVPYRTPDSDAGPGEEKVAAEFGVSRHGQNSPYDMDVPMGDTIYKFEVKEPDAADSFPCGRNGRDALRPIKMEIAALLRCFVDLAETPTLSEELRTTLRTLTTVSPDELGSCNLQTIDKTCRALSSLRQALLSNLPQFTLINPFTGDPTEVSAQACMATAKVWGLTEEVLVEKMGADILGIVRVLACLENVYIRTPEQFLADLTGLPHIFRGYILVLVHEDKGYYLMDSPETKVTFNRITRGTPRFKVDVMERPAASRRGGRRKRTEPHSPADDTCSK